MNAPTRLALTAAALELFAGLFGFASGGLMAGAAALIGASIATGAQVAAVALLRPAMQAAAARFQQRWALGIGIRLGSFVVLAVLLVLTKQRLPPLWMAAGYLGTMLVLLFAETRFLR